MSFTCPECGRTSHHPEDEKQGYCGACHKFFDPLRIADAFERAAAIVEEAGLTNVAKALRGESERWMKRVAFDPNWVVKPGETIREYMQEHNLSVGQLSIYCNLDVNVLNAWLRRVPLPITERHAEALERGTGIPASFWRNLERNYREGLAAGKEDVS